tara:strand:- start:35 stop:214 length:180 start_codon:yes stop_codon:yes gene_type:complete
MLELIIGIILVVVMVWLMWGAMLIVNDKQREFIKHKQEQVSGEETNGDDTGRQSKEKDS